MLPDWITQDPDKPARFRIDADLAYESMFVALKQLPDQYWLEVAHNCIKIAAQLAIAQAGLKPEGCTELIIQGGDGYKDRWGWRNHPPGRHADLREQDENLFARTVALESREHFRRAFGYLPA